MPVTQPYLASGSITVEGSATESVKFHCVGSGSIVLEGSAILVVHYSNYTGSGRIVLRGSSTPKIILEYLSEGGEIVLSGHGPSYFYNTYSISSTWDIIVPVIANQSFTWDNRGSNTNKYGSHWEWGTDPITSNVNPSGGPIVYWWRVTGVCTPLNTAGCPTGIQGDSDCNTPMSYQQTLTAYDLEDLCVRLKQTFLTYPVYKWKVKKVERWKRPLRSQTDAAESNDCNYLMEEPDLCNIPECLDFCLETNPSNTDITTIRVNTYLIPIFTAVGSSDDPNSHSLIDSHSSGGWIVIQGQSVCRIKPPTISGGSISLLGVASALSNAYYYKAHAGPIVVGGKGNAKCQHYSYRGRGGIAISGNTFSTDKQWMFVGGGPLNISGESNAEPIFTCVGKGSIRLSGSMIIPLPITTDPVVMVGSSTMVYESVSSQETEEPLKWTPSIVDSAAFIPTNCACNSLPNYLYFYNNLNQLNKFSSFISINNLKMPISDSIVYSNALHGWQKIYHFRGNGIENNTREDWLLRTDWICSNTVEGNFIGAYSWEFTLLIKRTVYFSSKTSVFSTKMNLLIQNSNQLCSPLPDIFKTKFYYNPLTKLFTADQNVSITGTVADNIGVMGSTTIFVQISSNAPSLPAPKMSLAPFLPKNTIFGSQ